MKFFENKWPACLLSPLSIPYGIAICLRNKLYDRHLLISHRLPCHVISVGNITVGGTGKTPTVIFLAKWFKMQNRRLCILSRGYGRESRGPVIVSDGHRICSSVHDSGDEPMLMARKLSGIPVVVDKNRVRGGQLIWDRFKPDLILLDDGFQHRRLHRQIDILTVKASHPFGNGFLLPAGPLRESRTALKRADMIWINSSAADNRFTFSLYSGKPSILSHYMPDTNRSENTAKLTRQDNINALTFCGLADPTSFIKTLTQAGYRVIKSIRFKDHYKYTRADIRKIEWEYKQSGADYIITTEKDWIKIVDILKPGPQWHYLAIQIIPDNIDKFEKLMTDICKVKGII